MPNPLDPIWRAYGITLDSYSVVRRSLALATPERVAVLQGSQFATAANDQSILDALDAAQEELDDQTVMFLYATFEAALRDHITAQGPLLGVVAQPGPQFGPSLQAWFTEFCKDIRMDKVCCLSRGPVLRALRKRVRFESTVIGWRTGNVARRRRPLHRSSHTTR